MSAVQCVPNCAESCRVLALCRRCSVCRTVLKAAECWNYVAVQCLSNCAESCRVLASCRRCSVCRTVPKAAEYCLHAGGVASAELCHGSELLAVVVTGGAKAGRRCQCQQYKQCQKSGIKVQTYPTLTAIFTHGSQFLLSHGSQFLLPHGSQFLLPHGSQLLLPHGSQFTLLHGYSDDASPVVSVTKCQFGDVSLVVPVRR